MEKDGEKLDTEDLIKALDVHGYDFVGPIGSGGFATAYKIVSRSYSTEFVAKAISLTKRTPESQIQSYEAEIKTLSSLMHPNVILIYDHFRTVDALYLILEYCPGGSFIEYIERNGPLDVQNLHRVTRQLLLALDYAHENGFVHRDIKPGNVFIDRYGRPKLADFGLARCVGTSMCSGLSGSRAFLAPEVWERRSFDPKKADIWALGITFYFLATGEYCWPDYQKARSVRELINQPVEFVTDFPKEFIPVIKKMMELDPDDRGTCKDILQLPFYANRDPNSARKRIPVLPALVRPIAKARNITPDVESHQGIITGRVVAPVVIRGGKRIRSLTPQTASWRTFHFPQ